MSWMKRPQANPGAPPGTVPYNPSQVPFQDPQVIQQQNIYANYGGNNLGQIPPQGQGQNQYWPQQNPQSYSQISNQPVYQQQNTEVMNTSTFFNNQTTPSYQSLQNNLHSNFDPQFNSLQPAQPVGQKAMQMSSNPQNQNWEENWDWGWEDASKQQNHIQLPPAQFQSVQQVDNQAVYQNSQNNANLIEESFSTSDSWNWSVDEKREANATQMNVGKEVENRVEQQLPTDIIQSALISTLPKDEKNYECIPPPLLENEKSLHDKDAVKEHIPALALGKRLNLENLTPQWSIESQMSQESSDGPHTQSESTYRSENQSRDSFSPAPSSENTNFNTIQNFNADNQAFTNSEDISENSAGFIVHDLTGSNEPSQLRHLTSEFNQFGIQEKTSNVENVQRNSLQTPSPTHASHEDKSSNQSVKPNPPPISFPNLNQLPSSSGNPFKRSGPLSHSVISKPLTSQTSSIMQPLSLVSPNAVNKVQQSHMSPYYQLTNLETTPENVERPDLQITPTLPPISQSGPVENLEVAPNDRNQYLQSSLDSGEYENVNYSHIPPLGLQRMVVGQQESEPHSNQRSHSDEPPPGLSRMVPGQLTDREDLYLPPDDSYRDRHIDGENIESLSSTRRPSYRQVEGQPNIESNYSPTSRASERRPIGLDRMVMGESSSEIYSRSQQFQQGYSNMGEERVVTGVDRDFIPVSSESNPELREQNVDGSDYSEPVVPPIPPRSLRSFTEQSQPMPAEPEEQREIVMEGENLQDLSTVSSTDLSFRDQRTEGAGGSSLPPENNIIPEAIDIHEHSSRRGSLSRASEDDSERDRVRKASPRRDREKKSSAKDRDGHRDERKYREGDRKYREDRRNDTDRYGNDHRERRDKDDKRLKSGRKKRYDTEDTDYFSDRERDRRRHREGSYAAASKPPRPDDRDARRREDKDRSRGYSTIERERRYYLDERDGYRSTRRDRGDKRYRSPDHPERRPSSRDPEPTEDELIERERRYRRHRNYDHYYDKYGSGYQDAYYLERQQVQTYQYYENLRLTNPVAYMEVYQKVMAGEPLPPPPSSVHQGPSTDPMRHSQRMQPGFPQIPGYDRLMRGGEERSVHSGRSSANAAKDTDFNTDASLNLQLEESTVRSERMTPCKFSTAHVKGNISTSNLVMIQPSYPIDGHPATVEILSLTSILENDPTKIELQTFPGPLVRGATHKKSVIDFCENKIKRALGRNFASSNNPNAELIAHDLAGYVLLWEFLILLLRQNGVVVGTDISELLMKNKRDFEIRMQNSRQQPNVTSSRRNSLMSSNTSRSDLVQDDEPVSPVTNNPDNTLVQEPTERDPSIDGSSKKPFDEKLALDKFREYLILGNRKEALDWAMKCGLWGHAMQLAASLEKRARLAVASKFLQSISSSDPLHTLYYSASARLPPVAKWNDDRNGDWRPHLAMVLSNPSSRPEVDKKTIITIGDTLASRGLLYSSQVCYLCGGEQLGLHPLTPWNQQPVLAPPKLALLCAPSNARSLNYLATNEAVQSTEIYEYACTLNQPDYVIPEFQVYKYLKCTRLVDVGLYEKALAYTEAIARSISIVPHTQNPNFISTLATLADRLKYYDPSQQDEGVVLEEDVNEFESQASSPQHSHWLTGLKNLAQNVQHASPYHPTPDHQVMAPPHAEPLAFEMTPAHSWPQEQQLHQQQTENETTAQENQTFNYTTQSYYSGESQQQAPPPTMYNPQEGINYFYPQTNETQTNQDHIDHQSQGQQDNSSWQTQNNQSNYGYNEPSTSELRKNSEGSNGTYDGGMVTQQISMPNTSGIKKSSLFDEYENEDQNKQDSKNEDKSQQQGSKNRKEDLNPKNPNQSAGWFGGIFNKLSLKPKNQMILPEDKNPSIVWDEDKKKWVNLEGEEEEGGGTLAPPPKMSDLAPNYMRKTSTPNSNTAMPVGGPPMTGATPAMMSGPPSSNIFKMQKSRQIKKAYVDVFNPSGAPIRPLPPAAEVLGPAAPNRFMQTDGQSPAMYDPSQH